MILITEIRRHRAGRRVARASRFLRQWGFLWGRRWWRTDTTDSLTCATVICRCPHSNSFFSLISLSLLYSKHQSGSKFSWNPINGTKLNFKSIITFLIENVWAVFLKAGWKTFFRVWYSKCKCFLRMVFNSIVKKVVKEVFLMWHCIRIRSLQINHFNF